MNPDVHLKDALDAYYPPRQTEFDVATAISLARLRQKRRWIATSGLVLVVVAAIGIGTLVVSA